MASCADLWRAAARVALVSATLACGGLGAPTGGAAAETAAAPQESSGGLGQLKGKYGDWELRCETPAGAPKEQCALLQSLAADDRPNVNLMVITLRTADKKSRLLRINAPLGILLPNGLGLQIDQTDIGRAGFVRCLPTGCVAEVIMDDKLIEQLRTGKTATFIIYQTPEEGIGIPMTLAGFGPGFDALP
jgi:invasion protein IalB